MPCAACPAPHVVGVPASAAAVLAAVAFATAVVTSLPGCVCADGVKVDGTPVRPLHGAAAALATCEVMSVPECVCAEGVNVVGTAPSCDHWTCAHASTPLASWSR